MKTILILIGILAMAGCEQAEYPIQEIMGPRQKQDSEIRGEWRKDNREIRKKAAKDYLSEPGMPKYWSDNVIYVESIENSLRELEDKIDLLEKTVVRHR